MKRALNMLLLPGFYFQDLFIIKLHFHVWMLDAMIIVGDGGGNCNHSWEQRHNVIQLGLRNPFDTLLTLTEVKIGSSTAVDR